MRRVLKPTVLVALLVALPFLVQATPFLGPTWVRILGFAMLYVMLALGLNIVIGFAGLLDMGYIAFYGIGAYLYALLASPHLVQAGVIQHAVSWPVWVILPLAAAVAGVAGALLGAPTLKLRGDYLAIVTLGFGEIIRIFMNNLDRPVNLTNGPQGINKLEPLHVGALSLRTTRHVLGLELTPPIQYYLVFLAFVGFTILLSRRLEDSRIGRAWMALREDEVAAEAMGIDKRNLKLLAFAMGASFGGLSGALFASYQGFVSPESFVLMESVMVLAMVVLGGMGSIPGVVVGAVVLAVTPELFRDLVNRLQRFILEHRASVDAESLRNALDPSTLRMLLFGLALVLVMRFRPEGLWPSRRRRQELHDADETPSA